MYTPSNSADIWVPAVPLNVRNYRARRNARFSTNEAHNSVVADRGCSPADIQSGDY